MGNRCQKKPGIGITHLALKPPGPCPRCRDYRHWHWAKDCRVLKCKKCNKIGHKSSKCPNRQHGDNTNGSNSDPFQPVPLTQFVLDI